VEVVASLSQGRTAAAQCDLFTYKSVPVIFEPPCIYFKNEAACCKITRYRISRLIGFAWSTFASLCGCVSDFESTGMYLLNRNRVSEYLFSIMMPAKV